MTTESRPRFPDAPNLWNQAFPTMWLDPPTLKLFASAAEGRRLTKRTDTRGAMPRAKKTTELPLKKAFGRRLRDIRERRDLSQKQLADLLSTDVMQISRYERGIGLPSLETCVQLAAILKVSTDELLLGREPRRTARDQ